LILDIGLPKLDGIEAAQRIRVLIPSAKIVFLTQKTTIEFVEKALELGAVGYVHKADMRSGLLPAIDAVLAGRPFVSSSLRNSQAL